MMTVIVYTRHPKTERGVGWEKKNLIVFEQNQLTARGLLRVRLFTADVDAEGRQFRQASGLEVAAQLLHVSLQ